MARYFFRRVLILAVCLPALLLSASLIYARGPGPVRRLPGPTPVRPVPAAQGPMMTPFMAPQTRSLISPFSPQNPGRFLASPFFNPFLVNPALANPAFANPLASLALTNPVLANAILTNAALTNPALSGLSPFAFSSPLLNSWLGTPGIGFPYGGYGGYGGYGSSSYGANNMVPSYAALYDYGGQAVRRAYAESNGTTSRASYAGAYPTQTQQDSQAKEMGLMMTAIGMPNQDGRLSWPLGLRILKDPKGKELEEQLDGLAQVAAIQAVQGQANARLVSEGRRLVDQIRSRLRKEEGDMPLALYQESDRFLKKLQESFQALQ